MLPSILNNFCCFGQLNGCCVKKLQMYSFCNGHYSKELICHHYGNETRAQSFTISNGNEVTGTNLVCLCNGGDVTDTVVLCIGNCNDVTDSIICLCNGNEITVT
jgi:hypothetical protein